MPFFIHTTLLRSSVSVLLSQDAGPDKAALFSCFTLFALSDL